LEAPELEFRPLTRLLSAFRPTATCAVGRDPLQLASLHVALRGWPRAPTVMSVERPSVIERPSAAGEDGLWFSPASQPRSAVQFMEEGKSVMQTVTLKNGVEMPIIGFGVFQIPEDETQAAVEAALEAGYRHLDTAVSYGNEEAVGAAIRASGIVREELFVTTKLWIQHSPTGNVQEDTKRSFDNSLHRLGVDYLDLYLIHQPLGDYYSEWRAMQELNKAGGARAIGVSNFHQDRLVDLILHNEIAPAVNQIETHPFHQRASDQELMREHGVQIESWGPFAEGRNNMFTDPLLSDIAAAHGKSVAQVVLRWLVQREVVVIPKSVKPERMAENIDILDFSLTEEEMKQISTLDAGTSLFFDHRDPEKVSWLGGRRYS